MALSNIERFDEIVGKTFALLYESFPVPRPLFPGIFIGEENVMIPDDFLGERFSPNAEFCMAALLWLESTGYISARDITQHALGGVVLTAKGLEALKAMPDSLQGPLGARLMEAAKTEGRELMRSLASQALSMGLQAIGR